MAGSPGRRHLRPPFRSSAWCRIPPGWVAEDGDTIVGFGFSWMTERFWFLSQLFVRPETQAKGIGQGLLSKTLMQAERNGTANRALITPHTTSRLPASI
jgi:GNAT superfamily N-acetyltransferase